MKKGVTKYILLIGICVFFILSLNLISSFSSWNKVLGDFYGTGYSPLKGNITYPKIMWEYDYPDGTSSYIMNPVLVDDINNNGIMEACTSAKDGYVRCFNALNGTEIWNYSIGGDAAGPDLIIANLYNNSERQIIQANRAGTFAIINGTSGTKLWGFTNSSSWIYSSSTAYDFIGNQEQEVLLKTIYGLFLFYNNGTGIWNYTYPTTMTGGFGLAMGDLDNNGEEEIIFGGADNITILNSNGSFVKGIALTPPYNSYSEGFGGLALTDFNSDGYLEIIVVYDNGYIYGINRSLDILWSRLVSSSYLDSRLAVGDIDNDSKPEFVTDSYDVAVRAFNAEDGSTLWDFYPIANSLGSPSIADIDNDGDLEVMDTVSGRFTILNGKYGYPENSVNILTNAHHSPPSLADVNNDGFLEVFIAGRGYPGIYPLEWKNKIVAISAGGNPPYTSHESSPVLNNNSLNWKIRGKNALGDNNILEYLGNNVTPIITNITKLNNINYSLVGDDVNNDGEIEIFAVNKSRIYSIYQNGSLNWSYSFSKPVIGSPLIADFNDDDVLDLLVGTNDTMFVFNVSSGLPFWNYTHNAADLIREPFYIFDMDGDNQSDIFYSFRQYFDKYIALKYNKSILFSNYIRYDVDNYYSSSIYSSSIYDFNKDGIMDFILAKGIGPVTINRMDDSAEIASGYVPGKILFTSIANINNDGYMDIVVGTENESYTPDDGSGYLAYLPYMGKNPGIFGLTYNYTTGTLVNSFNYSTGNISGGIATSDINGDGYSESIFGDIANKLYAVNSSGSLVWNLNLGEKMIYPPMVVRIDDSDIIIATSNDSVFFVNSSGSIFYIYNSSFNFTYSPIILDLNKDCNGEIIIADVAGNITSLDFSNSGNSLYGNLSIDIYENEYIPKNTGKGLCGGVTLDVDSYDSSGASLSLDGSSEGNITLDGLTSSTNYEVRGVEGGEESISYLYSDINGELSFSYIVDNFKVFDISPYVAPSSNNGNNNFNINANIFVSFGESWKEFSLGKKGVAVFNFNKEFHKVAINNIVGGKVSFSINSTPTNYNLGINENAKKDLNGDGFYDMEIKVLNISSNSVKLGIRSINEKIINDNENGEPSTAENNAPKEIANNDRSNNINENPTEGKSKIIYYIIAIIIVLGIIIFASKKFKRKRRYYEFGY